MTNKITCCAIGCEPESFPWNFGNKNCVRHQEYIESLVCNIDLFIRKNGINYFICGGAQGLDTDFANTVLNLRDNLYNDIMLEIVIPYRGQCNLLNKRNMETYSSIIERADKVHCISTYKTTNCIHRQIEYMIDCSDIVLIFQNQFKISNEIHYAFEYAKQKHKNIELFNLNDF